MEPLTAFRLENTTNQVQTTPNKELFAIQKRIDGAWKHLFYVDESHGYDANAVVHEPGGGFKWSFSVTRGWLWLRSTAVERRGRSLPHRPRTRRRRVFDRLVEQAACRGLLDLTYSIDSTDVRTMPADQDASKGYDPTAEEYYHGYGCTIVSTGQKIPIAAEFTESKQAPEETAMRVTCDALAVEKPIWMLGDSAYDTLGWHDHLLAAGVVPVAPYNARNTDDPKDIEYRVEARIDEHSEDVQLKQSTLDETYNRRSGVERTNDAVRTAASGTFAPEAASTHEHKCSSRCAFVSLLRSPTTNAETIQEAPSSRYENYSMTPSVTIQLDK